MNAIGAREDGAYEARLARGREIASHPEEIEKLAGNEWSVPSQSGFGRYRVLFVDGSYSCGCKDFAGRLGEPCKHILAVIEKAAMPGPVPVASRPRKKYPQHASYTEAQTKEMRLVDMLLRDLVTAIPDIPRIPGAPGAPAIPLSKAIQCAVLKVYSGLSGRRACGVYENVADRGLLQGVPSFMVASRLLSRPDATPVLYRLLTLSALPLAGLEEGGAVAPDSTGMQTTQFGGWREEKHGEKREKKWLKVHAMVGLKTHVVIQAVVGEEHGGDAPQFAPLLRGTIEAGFQPAQIQADKGYLSKDNYRLASELGVEPFIMFKSNSVSRASGESSPAAWRKAFYLFQAHREEFERNYHKRSNVESAFSAIKRKFGESIRSKKGVSQINEILCKLIAYNLTVLVHEMFENGIAPVFADKETTVAS